jgi:hypothetical protein
METLYSVKGLDDEKNLVDQSLFDTIPVSPAG